MDVIWNRRDRNRGLFFSLFWKDVLSGARLFLLSRAGGRETATGRNERERTGAASALFAPTRLGRITASSALTQTI